MSRKVLLIFAFVLLIGAAVWAVSAQEAEGYPIVTNAAEVVGVGSYSAWQPVGWPAGEDPAAAPARAAITSFAIYPNMGVMSMADFVQPTAPEDMAELTFAWAFTAPEGSAATLNTDGWVVFFQADVEGEYVLTLTVTDVNGNTAEVSKTITATTYVGNGAFGDPSYPQCALCHEEQTEIWAETGHASMLTRGVDGLIGSYYGEGCISCHTTGFDPNAANGGFDDVAAEAGWTFPETLQAGNWDAMLADFPAVAGMGNIQCESCHGPGALHGGDGPISVSLDYGVCAQCHGEETHHVFPMQWENSGHGNIYGGGALEPIGAGEEACVRCHSGVGYIDYLSGVPEAERRTDYQPITCAVCHDPHDATNPTQLRSYDTVVLPEGEFAGVGAAATCMNCHNVRRDGGAAAQVDNFATAGRMSAPHEGNNQAELMLGIGGYTWGETLTSSPHGQVVEGSCTGCHMGATPGFDNMGTPDDSSDDQPLPGRHTVGGHSMAMASEAAGENVVVCQQCHVGAASFEFESARDYDGDGAYESVQDEVAGLREMLYNALVAGGIPDAEKMRGATIPADASPELLGAYWNYHFTGWPGTAVHNFRYTVALLRLSIERVTGAPAPGDPLPVR